MLTSKQFDSWINELENGGLKQATGCLSFTTDEDGKPQERRFCCLGVLAEKVLGVDLTQPILVYGSDREDVLTGPYDLETATWVGGVGRAPLELAEALPHRLRDTLAVMNDSGAFDFAGIAEWLKDHRNEIVKDGE